MPVVDFSNDEHLFFGQMAEGLPRGSALKWAEDHVDAPRVAWGRIETAFINGALPSPSPAWAGAGWIDSHHWDVFVYMNVEALEPGGFVYISRKTMLARAGVLQVAGSGARAIANQRRENLLPVLQAAGLIRDDGAHPTKGTRWQIMRVPAFTTSGFASSTEPRGRVEPFTMLPRRLFAIPAGPEGSGKYKSSVWALVRSHASRRVLCAIYWALDSISGIVDPNHLRLEDNKLVLSPQFVRACGNQDPLEITRELGGLAYSATQNRSLSVVRAQFDRVRSHPGTEARIIGTTLLRRGADERRTAVFMPTRLPTLGEGEADGD